MNVELRRCFVATEVSILLKADLELKMSRYNYYQLLLFYVLSGRCIIDGKVL